MGSPNRLQTSEVILIRPQRWMVIMVIVTFCKKLLICNDFNHRSDMDGDGEFQKRERSDDKGDHSSEIDGDSALHEVRDDKDELTRFV